VPDSTDTVAAAEQDLANAYAKAKANGALDATEVSGKGSASHPAEWTPQLVTQLSLGLSIFALISLVLASILIAKRRNAEQVLRTFGILVIIFAAIFLVVAGYSDTQITPVIGLLGTIAGYLLGRRIEPSGSDKKSEPSTTDEPAN